MFERSKSGQQNKAIFLEVDYICYVEGGGGASDNSIDGYFWSKLAKSLRGDLKIRFIPRGGKPALETMAKRVIDEDINNTLVAMDSDYDELNSERLEDRRILYTFGYSWENDAFHANSIHRIFEEVAQIHSSLSAEVVSYLNDGIARLTRELRWIARADYLALLHKSSVLPRQSPGRIIGLCPHTDLPNVKFDEIFKIISKLNDPGRERKKVADELPVDILRHCVGHVYAFACVSLIRSTHKHFKSRSLPSHAHITSIAIQVLSEEVGQPASSAVGEHYTSTFGAI